MAKVCRRVGRQRLWRGALVLSCAGGGLALLVGCGEDSARSPAPTSTENVAVDTSVIAGTSTTTSPLTTDDQRIADCRARAQAAKTTLKFGSTYTMTVGEPSLVEFFAGLGALPLSTVTIANAASTTEITLSSASCFIEARLHGQLFDIDVKEPVRKSFATTDLVKWSWAVTPLSARATTLQVDLTTIGMLATGSFVEVESITTTQTITVKAAPPKPARPWYSKAWGWLVALFLGILGVLGTQWALAAFGPDKDDSSRYNVFRRRARKDRTPD
jgi:hypothetical protein